MKSTHVFKTSCKLPKLIHTELPTYIQSQSMNILKGIVANIGDLRW